MNAGPIRRDPAEKRARLLNAARALFLRQGYEASSTAEIAREAGVSEGILFHHFRSKRGLFLCLVEDFGREMAAAAMPDVTEPLTEEAVVRQAFDFADANPCLYRLLTTPPPEIADLDLIGRDVVVSAIRDKLEGAVIAGRVRNGDTLIMAQFQFAIVHAAYRSWRETNESGRREAYIQEAVASMQAMLAPPAPAAATSTGGSVP